MTAEPPFRVLGLDRASERSVALLRIAAAVAVTASAIWLVLLRPPWPAWICVLAGLAASVFWIATGMRSRARLADPERHRLLLEPDALRLVEGARERRIAWDHVVSVATDEEKLCVSIEVSGEDPLVIEPRYGGLGAYDLERAIRRAQEAARDAGPGPA